MAGDPITLVSPAERPKPVRDLGKSHVLPEQYGADVMIVHVTRGKVLRVGVQRKTVDDLLASIEDNRLSKEIQQMRRLDVAVLLVEGSLRFTADGMLPRRWGRAWTQKQIRGVLWSMMLEGIWVDYVANPTQFATYVEDLRAWVKKDRHRFGDRRNKKSVELWGTTRKDRDYATWLLQGLPGIGPEMADRIYAYFDGLPWEWSISREELMEVEGVGEKTVEKIWKVLSDG